MSTHDDFENHLRLGLILVFALALPTAATAAATDGSLRLGDFGPQFTVGTAEGTGGGDFESLDEARLTLAHRFRDRLVFMTGFSVVRVRGESAGIDASRSPSSERA